MSTNDHQAQQRAKQRGQSENALVQALMRMFLMMMLTMIKGDDGDNEYDDEDFSESEN